MGTVVNHRGEVFSTPFERDFAAELDRLCHLLASARNGLIDLEGLREEPVAAHLDAARSALNTAMGHLVVSKRKLTLRR